MSHLTGKVAIVTGAARDRSIGGGIARVLARHGADVVVNDLAVSDEGERRVQEIEALGRRARADRGRRHRPGLCGGADGRRRWSAWAGSTSSSQMPGVCDWQYVADMSAELWDRIVGVNLHGCFNTCRAAAAQMRAGGEGGRIVATSSVHAQMPFAQMGVYGGTKQAVGHLVGVMAREWARDRITVNHIGPGWVASAINDTSPDFSTEEARLGVRRIIPVGHRAGRARGDGRGRGVPGERRGPLHDGRVHPGRRRPRHGAVLR